MRILGALGPRQVSAPHSVSVAGRAFGRGASDVPPPFPWATSAHPSPLGERGREPRGQRRGSLAGERAGRPGAGRPPRYSQAAPGPRLPGPGSGAGGQGWFISASRSQSRR